MRREISALVAWRTSGRPVVPHGVSLSLGGAERLATVRSLVIRGMYGGTDTLSLRVPVEIYVRAPNQRAMIVHTFDGDTTTVYDGQAAWIAAPETMKPVSVLRLTGGNLDAARIETELFFPARINEIATDWRVGSITGIDDRDVHLSRHPGAARADSQATSGARWAIGEC